MEQENNSALQSSSSTKKAGPIFECKALTKSYGKKRGIKNIGLKLQRGKVYGLLGKKGSGKTTLIKLACGLITPDSGRIAIKGIPPCTFTKSLISYIPQYAFFDDNMSINGYLSFYSDFFPDFNRRKAEKMIAKQALELKLKAFELTYIERKKLQLILTMCRSADLYLIDEPFAGVDTATREKLLDIIILGANPKSTIVIATRMVSDVEKIIDEAIFIHKGEIRLKKSVEAIREEYDMGVANLFMEAFK